jgi:hypothetical protein
MSLHSLIKLKTCKFSHIATDAEQSRAVAYCRQPASTVTLGIESRWDPWPYICSMSRFLFFFSSFVVPPLIKGRGWAFLLRLTASQLSLYSRSTDRTENSLSTLLHIRGNVFIDSLPRNGLRNTAVLLLRNLATEYLPGRFLATLWSSILQYIYIL